MKSCEILDVQIHKFKCGIDSDSHQVLILFKPIRYLDFQPQKHCCNPQKSHFVFSPAGSPSWFYLTQMPLLNRAQLEGTDWSVVSYKPYGGMYCRLCGVRAVPAVKNVSLRRYKAFGMSSVQYSTERFSLLAKWAGALTESGGARPWRDWF